MPATAAPGCDGTGSSLHLWLQLDGGGRASVLHVRRYLMGGGTAFVLYVGRCLMGEGTVCSPCEKVSGGEAQCLFFMGEAA